MARKPLLARLILYPLSRIFAAVVAVRNQMFKRGILKTATFRVPVVVVGNLAVGGTGKTPHVEYLIEALRDRFHPGVLSRGYRRKTKGFVLASEHSSPDDIGDETFQLLSKYHTDATIAVCEKRVEGIERMLDIDPDISVMLLDDAFQHRYVKPTVAVVLTEYSRPAFDDKMLPYGRLREPVSALERADIVVVTKCPVTLKPMDYRVTRERLHLEPWQKLFFSRYIYGHHVPLFPAAVQQVPFLERLTPDDGILVVSGIANPRPFIRHLRRYRVPVRMLCFPDHHNFDHDDIQTIVKKFTGMSGRVKYIITTEKDSVRLTHNPYFPHQLKPLTFYLPISVEFISQYSDGDFTETVNKLLTAKPLP